MAKVKTKAKAAPQSKPRKPLSIGAFFGRFHAVLFFVVVCGSLTAAVYMLSTIIDGSATPTGYSPPSTSASFDTETIQRVEQLRNLDTPPPPLELPAGVRSDPFAG